MRTRGSKCLALCGFITVLGCGRNTDARLSPAYQVVQELGGSKVSDSLRIVLVIGEEGCLSCDRALATFAARYRGDRRMLIWMEASGQGVDISPFLTDSSRVVWDYDDRLQRTGLLQGSGALFLRQGVLDTIVPADVFNIHSLVAMVADTLGDPR